MQYKQIFLLCFSSFIPDDPRLTRVLCRPNLKLSLGKQETRAFTGLLLCLCCIFYQYFENLKTYFRGGRFQLGVHNGTFISVTTHSKTDVFLAYSSATKLFHCNTPSGLPRAHLITRKQLSFFFICGAV